MLHFNIYMSRTFTANTLQNNKVGIVNVDRSTGKNICTEPAQAQ